MNLIARRQIRTGVGTIEPDQPFVAEGKYAERLIAEGAAAPAADADKAPWTGRGYWRVQPEWAGETVAILAGGPSLTEEQAVGVQHLKIIAINNAMGMMPGAEIGYFCDARWLQWHGDMVRGFGGRLVTLENLPLQRELEVRSLRDYGVHGFAPKNDGVTNGRNSGYQALHLAAWLGAKRVLLLGFDMRQVSGRMHWHEEHPVPTPANIFAGWLSCFEELAPVLKARDVEVINCTPDSALKAFPMMSLAAALGHEPPVPTRAEIAQNDRYIESLAAAPEPTPWPGVHPNQETPDPGYAHERAGEFGGAGASGGWDSGSGSSDSGSSGSDSGSSGSDSGSSSGGSD